MIWTYSGDGRREPFDPANLHFAGCILCGDPRIAGVGMFVPATDEMRLAVLPIRRRPPSAGMTGGLAYGLCHACADDPDFCENVEAVILAAAGRATVQ